MRVAVVTGYVRIPGHPRSDDEYKSLGARLLQVRGTPIHAFHPDLKDCWLDAFARASFVTHAVADNPKKNTIDYHIVQHQKSEWLRAASELVPPAADVLVWIDYGIFSQPGITTEVIEAFLQRVAAADELNEICIPGAWDRSNGSPNTPDWRFLGSSLIMPRIHARAFHDAVADATLARLVETGRVTWEVNDWATVERQKILPIRWYKADHNQTQFTDYGAH